MHKVRDSQQTVFLLVPRAVTDQAVAASMLIAVGLVAYERSK